MACRLGKSFGVRTLRWMTEKTISIWFEPGGVEGQVDEHEVRPLLAQAVS